MDINLLSKEVKEEWIEDINNFEDADALGNQSRRYIEILKRLADIDKARNHCSDSFEDKYTESDITEDNDTALPQSESTFVFERRLRGGIAKRGDRIEPVPEGVVRNENLENGDQLDIKFHATGTGFHKFIKRGDLPSEEVPQDPAIIEYNQAIVDYDDMLGYIIKSYYNEGKLTSLSPFFINQKDVDKFDLHKGDLIDGARLEDNNHVRVRWRYNTEQPILPPKPHKPSYYKDTQSTEDTSKEDFENSPLYGKSICIVGGNSHISSFTEEAEKRNATIDHVTSDRNALIQTSVSQSDAVVIPIFETSHTKMETAKDYAKKMNKPFVILRTHGRTNFVKELEEALSEV